MSRKIFEPEMTCYNNTFTFNNVKKHSGDGVSFYISVNNENKSNEAKCETFLTFNLLVK